MFTWYRIPVYMLDRSNLPCPSSLACEMDHITAFDSDCDCPGRIVTFTVIFTSCHDKDTVASYTETGKGTLALLTDVAVYGHKILGAIYQHHAGLGADVRKESGD